MDLSYNPIGECGLEYLANALQTNKVRKMLLVILYLFIILNIDTNRIGTM
jgi:hypothetical protein